MGLRSWFENLVGGAAAVVPIAEADPGYDYDDPDVNLPGTQAAGNWRRITQAASDLPPLKHDEMQKLALYLSDRNPLARGILDLIVSFIVGEGFTVRSKDEDVQKIIDRMWDDAQNDMDTRTEDLTRELSIYGEQLLLAFVNEQSGRVALVSVDPRQIKAVAPHPTATDRAYAVGLAPDVSTASEYRWLKIIEEDQDPSSPTFGMLVGAESGESVKVGERSIPFYQPQRDQTATDTTRLVGCFFWAVNKPRSALRGRSDLLAVADNVDMLDQFLFDEGQRMSFQRVFAWWCKITGADEKQIRERAAQSAAPKPGGVLFTNESEEWSVLAPDLNTQDSANYADLQLSSIATAVGMPKGWLNGTMDVNRAQATEMQEPGIKRMVRRQKYVRRMLERLVRFALDQAEIAGALPPADDGRHDFTVSTPEMSSRDLQRGASSLQTTVQAMGMATAARWIDVQTAQDAVALMLGQIGLDVDLDDVRARLAAAEEGADDETAGEIPDYFGMGKFAGSDTLARALAGNRNGTNGHAPRPNATGQEMGPDGPVVPVVSPAAKDVASIIAQVSKALVELGNAGVIDGEFAQEVVAKLFHSLGVDVDIAAMQARLEQAKAEATNPPAPAAEPGAGGGAPPSPADLPETADELIDLDAMALEAIRALGDDVLREADPDLENEPDDALWMGLRLLTEAFDAALHPRGAGGKFAPKPKAAEPDAGDDAGGSDVDPETEAKAMALARELIAKQKAKAERRAKDPNAPKKPPAALSQADMKSAIAGLQPGATVNLKLANGLEISGTVEIKSGDVVMVKTGEGQYAALHPGLKGIASVTSGETTVTPSPRKPREPKEPKPKADRSESARKAAATRAANRAAAAAGAPA